MTTAPPTDTGTSPFDLPVLAELPELATALQALVAADRALTVAVDQLVRLRSSGLVEAATGVGLDGWLGIVARRTGSDRRMLLTVADTLGRLPQLHRCFAAGELSWAQLRAVVLQVHQLTGIDEVALDTALAGAATEAVGLDPDALAGMVRWIVADLSPDPTTDRDRPIDQRLVLQPRLDGTGGAVIGELGPVGFAALDTATRPPTGSDRPAHHRAEALTELCLTATTGPGPTAGPTGDAATARLRPGVHRTHLLVRADLTTLLGLDDQPAQLLTTLAGGAMWTDAPTARQLATTATSLRLIVTDRGRTVGVGRRTRDVPHWLRDAILAFHDTCTFPGCTHPALTADTDHATPWNRGGTTDADNLAPLCPHHNRAPHRHTWHLEQHPDGTRHWHHPATGLTTTTRPGRPPPRPPPAGPADPGPRSARAGPPAPPHPAGPDATPDPPTT